MRRVMTDKPDRLIPKYTQIRNGMLAISLAKYSLRHSSDDEQSNES